MSINVCLWLELYMFFVLHDYYDMNVIFFVFCRPVMKGVRHSPTFPYISMVPKTVPFILIWYLGHWQFKGTNGRQKTYEIYHVYSIFYSGFMFQTTVIFGITKDGSLY